MQNEFAYTVRRERHETIIELPKHKAMTDSGSLLVRTYTPTQQKLLDKYHRSVANLSASTLATPPTDKYNFVLLVSNLLGVGSLLGYNVLVTSSDYLTNHFGSAITFWIVPVSFFFLKSFTKNKKKKKKKKKRTLFLMAFPVLCQSLSEMGGYIVTLALAVWIGMTSSIIQGTALGFTALLQPKYAQVCVSGQALAGIIACVIRIITKAAMSGSTKKINQGGLVYYIIGGVVSLVCAVLFVIAFRTAFVQHRLSEYFVRWYRQQLKLSGSLVYVVLFLVFRSHTQLTVNVLSFFCEVASKTKQAITIMTI
ncbi:hypothetical protein RFI_25419 [Reticulomyxa filosa]|uniref:Uncharacterized protein n=1 Tax=Reticulomyxa filosa TaxID=46433 RepID=X6MDL3_RETFI|nr:hypothetical protein RFI_25419 [Reticulomyxa filosa]|eukprot:ETO11959.1 hypothetical protein RFI_25419 [Reticulomyxa filosa]